MPWYYYATVALLLCLGLALCTGKTLKYRDRDPHACRIREETGGYFIGRKFCGTHNIVWDDGGRCSRAGEVPGQPFHMMSWGEPSERRW